MSNRIRKDDIHRLLIRAATLTKQETLVIVGSSAAILGLKTIPLDISYTPDIDIYAPDAEDVQQASDAIDFVIGEGSDFHQENGFYAHGVDETTSSMPADWSCRAKRLTISQDPKVTCICPDIHDIAIAKTCAWREKDKLWLRTVYEAGLIKLDRLLELAERVPRGSAPEVAEIQRRARQMTDPQAIEKVPRSSGDKLPPQCGNAESGQASAKQEPPFAAVRKATPIRQTETSQRKRNAGKGIAD